MKWLRMRSNYLIMWNDYVWEVICLIMWNDYVWEVFA